MSRVVARSLQAVARPLAPAGLILLPTWGLLAMFGMTTLAGMAFHGMLACACGGLIISIVSGRHPTGGTRA